MAQAFPCQFVNRITMLHYLGLQDHLIMALLNSHLHFVIKVPFFHANLMADQIDL